MRLVKTKGLGSPAAIRHDGKCKEVMIDPAIWPKIPKAQRRFILEHELAHCRYNIFDEQEADRIGFIEFIRKGGKAEVAGRAISDNLSLSDPAVRQRHKAMQTRINQLYNNQPISHFGPDFGGLYGDPPPSPAQTGGWSPSDWNQLIDTIADSVADVITGNSRGGAPYTNYPYPAPRENNSQIYLIAIAVLAIIILLFLLKK